MEDQPIDTPCEPVASQLSIIDEPSHTERRVYQSDSSTEDEDDDEVFSDDDDISTINEDTSTRNEDCDELNSESKRGKLLL